MFAFSGPRYLLFERPLLEVGMLALAFPLRIRLPMTCPLSRGFVPLSHLSLVTLALALGLV